MKMLNKIFKAEDIRLIDQYTIDNESIISIDLMERAAEIWVKKNLEIFQKAKSVVVVAGCGNNGGDGYAIARMLHREEVEVTVYKLDGENDMSQDCRTNYRRWLAMGENVREVREIADFDLPEHCIVIDAIFGSGLNRPVAGRIAEVIRKINASSNKVYAVDMPSGLMSEDNSSNIPDHIVRADFTLTFQFPKLAFLLPENDVYVGEWEVLDIGLSCEGIAQTNTDWYYTTIGDIREKLPRPGKFAHKGMNGRGMLIAGSYGMMGAAVLAAKAAIRSGVGILHCHIPARCVDVMQVAVPESIVDIDETAGQFSDIGELEKYDALAVGPAIGRAPETVEALKKLLKNWRKITVLDADALTILAEHPELLILLHDKCILTPHVKEFERLAGKCKNDFDRLNKLSIFANRYNVYIVLKGAYSVIATPQGQFYFNMSGNPGMAKGGAGDVLTGVLLALAASGLEVLDVARIGVFAHGYSGDLLLADNGYRGISSGMIAEGMCKAWRKLETL